MKQVLHVFRAGLAASICLTVLAACQDGRGQFKSRRSALTERCEWQKANGKPSECEGAVETKADEFPGWKGVTPENKPSIFEKEAKSRPDGVGGEPAKNQAEGAKPAPPDSNPGNAQGHTITEKDKTNPPAEDTSAIVREKFLAETKNRLDVKDAEVTKLIKGISIRGTVDRTEKVVRIDLDAVAVVGGKERLVNMKPVPVKFVSETKIRELEYNLFEKPNGAPVEKKDLLVISGACADPKCEDVRLIMQFKVWEGHLWAVFQLTYAGDDKYKIKADNLVKRIEFDEALVEFMKNSAAGPEEAGKNGEGSTVAERQDEKKEDGKKEDADKDKAQNKEDDSKGVSGGKDDKIEKSPEFEPAKRPEVPPIVNVVNSSKERPAANSLVPPSQLKPELKLNSGGSANQDSIMFKPQSAGQKPAAPAAPGAAVTSAPAPASPTKKRENVAQSGGRGLNEKLDAPKPAILTQSRPTKPATTASAPAVTHAAVTTPEKKRESVAQSGGKGLNGQDFINPDAKKPAILAVQKK